ncbi:MAG: mechanosensitive ion channel [Bacteroidales bacterium]|nr:mechanosensitive ion channel [Bacteroidales bacterium]
MKSILYLVAGVGLFILFNLSFMLLQKLAYNKKSVRLFLRVFPVIELVAWLVFAVFTLKGLLSEMEGYQEIIIVVVSIILITIGWYFLRDYIAGTILKVENAFAVNQQIITPEIHGTIKKVGYRSLEVESESGQFSKLPYSRLSGQIFSLQAPAESILSHELTMEIPSTQKIESIKEQIVKELLLLPWVSVNHTPEIKTISETNEVITLRIIYSTSNENQTSVINQYIRKRFEEK